MENRFCVLQKHLKELGYSQQLSFDSVPLVERLLGDLIKTTESLQYYKDVAQEALEERDQLQLGAEPYKCDNAKLIKECNDLHLTFVHFKEQTEKLQKDLNQRIDTLRTEKEELIKRIQSHKSECSRRPLTAHQSTVSTTKSKCSLNSTDSKTRFPENTMMDQKIVQLNKEIKKLKCERSQQFELIDSLNNKLVTRNKEIDRLNKQLCGGRPIQALNTDCCYKDINARITKMNDINTMLSKEKRDLETQLADAISKQHEAMKRALSLADRNKELEKELKDLDQMALAVEADCNSVVQQNVDKVSKYQGELDHCNYKIMDLERELAEMKRNKNCLEASLDTVKHEKENLQGILETALEDKKRLTDRINQFTRIENDLNIEIDKLTQTTTRQQRKISELECQIVRGQFDDKPQTESVQSLYRSSSSDKDMENVCKCCQKCIIAKKKKSASPMVSKQSGPDKYKTTSEKEKSARKSGDRGECEQCKTLRDEIEKYKDQQDNISELKSKLAQKEQAITNLQQENKDAVREKHEMISKLESAREMNELDRELNGMPIKSVISRLEKERDIARGDVRRLEEERDALRKRIKTSMETHTAEREKLQNLLTTTEEKLLKIETDRREMMTVQGSRRATINNLEEQVETLTDQLRTTKSELTHMQTLYNQLKTLQEQTDHALADSQSQLTQMEMEMTRSQDRVKDLERGRFELDEELATLRNDIIILKGNLHKLDTEKDTLLIEVDNKTEIIATLQEDLKMKENKLETLEKTIAELKHKLSLSFDHSSSKEYLLKNSSAEIASLKRELENATEMRNNALADNRRLQDELSSVTTEYRNLNNEFEISKREIEDLKRQLQQYVFEVKRAEDLISKKEMERSEMLDQFRSLSHEATILESNNHSLETQAFEAKTQLNDALNQVTDLQHKVEQLETMNKGYEKQLSQLTSQVANMEIQIKQHGSLQNNTEAELLSVRNLCVKLDEQKDKLLKDLADKNEYQSQLEQERDRLQREIQRVKEHVVKEQSNCGCLENLLASSRQEVVEQKLLSEELQTEVNRLRKIVEELQSKLTDTSQQLDVFQEKAFEYGQQLKQLRREMANERFTRDVSPDVNPDMPIQTAASNPKSTSKETPTGVDTEHSAPLSDAPDLNVGIQTDSLECPFKCNSQLSVSEHITESTQTSNERSKKKSPERNVQENGSALKLYDMSVPPFCYYTEHPFRHIIKHPKTTDPTSQGKNKLT